MTLAEKLKKAGVVGAGGAGFPTYVKSESQVEFVIANGAECEPLVHKDFELMVHFPEELVKGMELMLDSTNAKKGYIGIKAKNAKAISAVQSKITGNKLTISQLGDFYPAGDEYELVYSTTKRLIPPAGIPLNIGCVVNNVETLYNIANADKDIPVTKKFLCVNGAVKKPSSFFVPLGTTFREVLAFAGGPIMSDFAIYVGGVMMGKLTFDLDEVVTKTTAALIILPKHHQLVTRKNKPEQSWYRIGKSACDQCSYCTEFCPRYLLGYDVQPHKVMRSLGFTTTGAEVWNQNAELCCACGLCTLYSCPEDLFPKETCDKAKKEMKSAGIKYQQTKPVTVHPMKEGRRVPVQRLIQRLQLKDYDVHTPYTDHMPQPSTVKILLKQHVGEKASATVSIGTKVNTGDVIAEVPENKLGAFIHAAITGTVTEITEDFVRINR
jgi:Na+-translocating ferredoxin:NAD+ oxidoreductase RnfC subunit